MKKLLNMNIIKRALFLWILSQLLLWGTFAISLFFHIDAWFNVINVDPSTAFVGNFTTTLLFIILNNLFICVLIAIGNIFVRFKNISPGLIVLIIQLVTIGYIAGANSFEIPFTSINAANMEFLKVGLWETTAYILVCAVTLPKSLLIADTFPAKTWSEVKKLKDIKLNKNEFAVIIISLTFIILAAFMETTKLFL